MADTDWTSDALTAFAESRKGAQEFVPNVPADKWLKDSDYAGWTYKDQLAHLPNSHRNFQGVLAEVLAGGVPDFSRFLKIDELNETNRQSHLDTPVEQLLAEFVEASEGTERWVAELQPKHADVKFGPMTFAMALQGFVMHDRAHLDEIRKAL
jgi:hypothetical protein